MEVGSVWREMGDACIARCSVGPGMVGAEVRSSERCSVGVWRGSGAGPVFTKLVCPGRCSATVLDNACFCVDCSVVF